MHTGFTREERDKEFHVPNIAMTESSFMISTDPLAMKQMAVRMSPGCINVSPGGACVVLNFKDSERKHPEENSEKRQNYN